MLTEEAAAPDETAIEQQEPALEMDARAALTPLLTEGEIGCISVDLDFFPLFCEL